MTTEAQNDENKPYKYLKVTSSDIALGNQSVNEGYTSVLRFTSTRVILNTAFRLFLGNKSLEDFIIETVKSFLSTLFIFEDDGSVKLKGNPTFENITIEGDANVKNLKVDGNTLIDCDLTTTGTITAYGGFTSCDPNVDPNSNPDVDPTPNPDVDPNADVNVTQNLDPNVDINPA